MMKFLILLPCALFANGFDITADFLESKRGKTYLEGNVSYTHTLGTAKAEKGLISVANKHVEAVALSKEVDVLFHEGSTLSCDSLTWKPEKNSAKAFGFPVVLHKNKKEIRIEGKELDFEIFPANNFQKWIVKKDVYIQFGTDESVSGDVGTYIEQPNNTALFTLIPKPSEKCLFSNALHKIEASEITLNAQENIWTFISPQGLLYNQVAFTSDTIYLEASGMSFLHCLGQTSISISNAARAQSLLCKGDVWINKETLQISAISEDSQALVYETPDLKLYADRGEFFFLEKESSLKPIRIEFFGNVHITPKNHTDFHCEATSVNYYPEDDKLELVGSEKPVIYYDETRQMTLTAEKVHVTNGSEVKGFGTVRFDFRNQ